MPQLCSSSPAAPASSAPTSWLRPSPPPASRSSTSTSSPTPAACATWSALRDDPRHIFVQGDIGDRALVRELLQKHRPRAIVHFAAESHVDRSIAGPGGLHPDQRGGHLRAAGGGEGVFRQHPLPARLDRRGLRLARPDRPGLHRDHAVRAQQPLCGVQGGRGPPGARLSPHLRPADADHQLLQQLRPAPVSGKAHPAHDQQRARRQAAPGLWRRQERARLALRARPLRSAARGAGARPRGRDLQHRRRRRAREHRPGEHHLRAARQGGCRAKAASTRS